jgi:hypothetical protein
MGATNCSLKVLSHKIYNFFFNTKFLEIICVLKLIVNVMSHLTNRFGIFTDFPKSSCSGVLYNCISETERESYKEVFSRHMGVTDGFSKAS